MCGDFHFGGTTAGDDGAVLDGAAHDHDSVVEGALDFGDELLGAAAEDQSAGFCGGTGGEEVVALGANLNFFEGAAGAEVFVADVAAGGLDGCARGRADTVEVA